MTVLVPANWSLLIGPCSLQTRSCPLGYLIGCHISQRSAALCLCLVQAVDFPSVDSGLHACRLALQRSVLQMYKGYCCSISCLSSTLYPTLTARSFLYPSTYIIYFNCLPPDTTAALYYRRPAIPRLAPCATNSSSVSPSADASTSNMQSIPAKHSGNEATRCRRRPFWWDTPVRDMGL